MGDDVILRNQPERQNNGNRNEAAFVEPSQSRGMIAVQPDHHRNCRYLDQICRIQNIVEQAEFSRLQVSGQTDSNRNGEEDPHGQRRFYLLLIRQPAIPNSYSEAKHRDTCNRQQMDRIFRHKG